MLVLPPSRPRSVKSRAMCTFSFMSDLSASRRLMISSDCPTGLCASRVSKWLFVKSSSRWDPRWEAGGGKSKGKSSVVQIQNCQALYRSKIVKRFTDPKLSSVVQVQIQNCVHWLHVEPTHSPSVLPSFTLDASHVIAGIWPCPRAAKGRIVLVHCMRIVQYSGTCVVKGRLATCVYISPCMYQPLHDRHFATRREEVGGKRMCEW
jgi:hypothetical protein